MTFRRTNTRKRDPITSPDASPEETAVHMACAPFDKATRDMDRKWGIDRLPGLVSVETAAKWGSALGKLNAAIEARDPAEVAARVGVCLRGLSAMDAEAEANGAQKANPEIWEYDLNGFKFAILRDGMEWQALKAARPDLLFFTLHEIAVALKAYKFDGVVAEIKRAFDGAQITAVRPEMKPACANSDLDDCIPF